MKAKRILWLAMALLLLMASGCSLPVAANTSAAATPEETPTAEATPSPTPVATLTPTPTIAPTETVTPTPTATPVQPLTVTEGKIVYSNANINANVVYPVISGMADVVVQSGINDGVRVYLQDEVDRIEAGAVDADAGSYSIETTYEVKRNDGLILSIRIDTTYYDGGANTGSDVAFINVINSDPAQQPRLEELFADGADYDDVIDAKISDMIADDPDAEVYDFRGVSPSQGYYLTPTSLVVVFERYSIAPGAAGEPEFVIPLSELSDILIPELL